jgi:hypothetical protein
MSSHILHRSFAVIRTFEAWKGSASVLIGALGSAAKRRFAKASNYLELGSIVTIG